MTNGTPTTRLAKPVLAYDFFRFLRRPLIAVCSTDAYYRKRKDAAFLTTCSVLMRTLKDESVPMVLRKTAWRLLNERYQRIKLNQAYRIENFLLFADFEYALEEHDELAE